MCLWHIFDFSIRTKRAKMVFYGLATEEQTLQVAASHRCLWRQFILAMNTLNSIRMPFLSKQQSRKQHRIAKRMSMLAWNRHTKERLFIGSRRVQRNFFVWLNVVQECCCVHPRSSTFAPWVIFFHNDRPGHMLIYVCACLLHSCNHAIALPTKQRVYTNKTEFKVKQILFEL